jgi:DNA polymerase/3'-5' exonuclease PolX
MYIKMGSITLEDVDKMSEEILDKLFEYQGLEPITGNIRLKKLTALIIYHNSDMLVPEDSHIVEDPQFRELYLYSENTIEEIKTILANTFQARLKIIKEDTFKKEMQNPKEIMLNNTLPTIRNSLGPLRNSPPKITQNEKIIVRDVQNVDIQQPQEIHHPEEEDPDLLITAETMNPQLVKIFEELGSYYQTVGDAVRSRAFFAVRDVIQNLQFGITSINQVKKMRHVGKSSLEVIDDYLKTGTSSRLNQLRKDHKQITDILELFMSVHGIGPVQAAKFYKLGCRTLDDLGQHKLTHAQSIGLTYYYHLQERIPRDEVNSYQYLIDSKCPFISSKEWQIVGSYRRKEDTCGDIDIIVKGDDLLTMNMIVEDIRKSGIVVAEIAQGLRKFMAVVKLPNTDSYYRRMDIRVFTLEEWAFALLYNTGSQQFNILCRQRAQELGYTLNEYSFQNVQTGDYIKVEIEDEIFDALHIPYLEPYERNFNKGDKLPSF